ncbi:hypothetical protein SAMN02799630_03579 [Paenibacillus sp. UNCCL117]|nr:hypothetical protein SAMN04488602_10840 [Paenibacillus sp. cl123]SFW48537.1 hypothetical protein SAMN02799630_03579 [Paenibacillus sp. UNCCL117]
MKTTHKLQAIFRQAFQPGNSLFFLPKDDSENGLEGLADTNCSGTQSYLERDTLHFYSICPSKSR